MFSLLSDIFFPYGAQKLITAAMQHVEFPSTLPSKVLSQVA